MRPGLHKPDLACGLGAVLRELDHEVDRRQPPPVRQLALPGGARVDEGPVEVQHQQQPLVALGAACGHGGRGSAAIRGGLGR